MSEVIDRLELGFSDEEFAVVPAAETGVLPIGKYIARITELDLVRKKDDATKIQLKWTLEVVGGKYDGRKIFRYSQWDTDQQKGFLKADMKSLGIDYTVPGYSYIDWLTEGKSECLDMLVEISVTHKKDDGGRVNASYWLQGVATDGAESSDENIKEREDTAKAAKPAKENPFL